MGRPDWKEACQQRKSDKCAVVFSGVRAQKKAKEKSDDHTSQDASVGNAPPSRCRCLFSAGHSGCGKGSKWHDAGLPTRGNEQKRERRERRLTVMEACAECRQTGSRHGRALEAAHTQQADTNGDEAAEGCCLMGPGQARPGRPMIHVVHGSRLESATPGTGRAYGLRRIPLFCVCQVSTHRCTEGGSE